MSRYTYEQLLATPPNTPTVNGPFTPGALDSVVAVPAVGEWDVTDFEPSHEDLDWVAALSASPTDTAFETPTKSPTPTDDVINNDVTEDDVIFVCEIPAAPIKKTPPPRTYAQVTAITLD